MAERQMETSGSWRGQIISNGASEIPADSSAVLDAYHTDITDRGAGRHGVRTHNGYDNNILIDQCMDLLHLQGPERLKFVEFVIENTIRNREIERGRPDEYDRRLLKAQLVAGEYLDPGNKIHDRLALLRDRLPRSEQSGLKATDCR